MRRTPRAPEPDRLDPDGAVALYGPMVWALCRRLDPDPEEAYQDVWAHLFTRLERYDPARGKPHAFIISVAHRRLVDRHRRRRVRRVYPLDEVESSASVEADVVARRRKQRLEAALLRLPEAQRRVVVAHHIHGRDLEAIANDEGCPVGTLKSRLHRGRARLAELMRRYR